MSGKCKKRVALLQVITLLMLSVFVNCDRVNAEQVTEIYSETTIGQQGKEITVPVKISGNNGIMGFRFYLDYDETCLTPVRVANQSLSNGVFDYNIVNNDLHRVDVMWSGTEPVYENGVLFDVVFKVSEYAKNGSTKIALSYSQEDTFDKHYQDVRIECSSITVPIEGEEKETEKPTDTPPVSPEETCVVYADEAKIQKGKIVSVPVSIKNNPGIMGFVMLVTYDTELLEPVSAEKGGVIPEGTTFDDNCTMGKGGTFKVLWSGTDPVEADGDLFTLNFQVKEEITEMGTVIGLDYKQSDTFDGDYNDVVMDCKPIVLRNVSPDVPAQTPSGGETETPSGTKKPDIPVGTPTGIPTISPINSCLLYADEVKMEPGKSVSIPVNVRNNPGIMGFLIIVRYDAKLLEPISVEKGEVIPYGTIFDDNCTTETGDTFRILWSGTDPVETEGCLFTLNFNVKEGMTETETVIELDYKQADTFDGDYNDVVLDCKSIVLKRTVSDVPTPTPLAGETEEPGTPMKTERPGIPSQTNEPGKPEGTKKPGTVTETDKPDIPEETDKPDVPEETEKPDVPEETGKPGIPEETEKPGTVTETEKPGGTPVPPNVQPGAVSPAGNVPGSNGQISAPSPAVNRLMPAQAVIKKVKAKGGRSIQVTWKKQGNIRGYQLQYAENKRFKKKKTKNVSASKGSVVLKKLKPKKKYYIRIRSYTYDNGKKVYGKWSKVKSCKVK